LTNASSLIEHFYQWGHEKHKPKRETVMSEQTGDEGLARVHNISNEVEQTLIEEVLKANAVQYIIRSFQDGPLDGIYTASYGFAEVLVPEKDAARARDLIKDALEQHPE
jgi:hypothetical protein